MVEFDKNNDQLQVHRRDSTPFHFLHMFPVDISFHNMPSPLFLNTIVERLAQKKALQDRDHEEKESELLSSPNFDTETPPRQSTKERHSPKRLSILV